MIEAPNAPVNLPAVDPPATTVDPQPPTAKEVAQKASAAIQQMKADLVQIGAMLQWEADHYFESALKHLNGVG